jgi:hypothetical protein
MFNSAVPVSTKMETLKSVIQIISLFLPTKSLMQVCFSLFEERIQDKTAHAS